MIASRVSGGFQCEHMYTPACGQCLCYLCSLTANPRINIWSQSFMIASEWPWSVTRHHVITPCTHTHTFLYMAFKTVCLLCHTQKHSFYFLFHSHWGFLSNITRRFTICSFHYFTGEPSTLFVSLILTSTISCCFQCNHIFYYSYAAVSSKAPWQ